MRILVVEDDAAFADLLLRCLREESYAVDHALDGQEAEWMAFENPYDLILLDNMLPRKDGMTVLKNLREGGVKSPILFLTAKDSPEDRVSGLDCGADDYVTKTVSLDELTARIRALLRRKEAFLPSILEVGPLKIDPSRKEVSISGHKVDFTAKEYGLLEYFARNSGRVLSRTQLSEHVWDVNFEPSSNVVDVYVGYLRTKISKVLKGSLIKTVRGHGYMLDFQEWDSSDQSDESIEEINEAEVETCL